jgi:hypothetical protein
MTSSSGSTNKIAPKDMLETTSTLRHYLVPVDHSHWIILRKNFNLGSAKWTMNFKSISLVLRTMEPRSKLYPRAVLPNWQMLLRQIIYKKAST